MVSRGGLSTFALGVAASLVAQASAGPLARRARPVARAIVKQALILGQGLRDRSEGLRQDLEDLAAEARAEVRAGARAQPPSVPSDAPREAGR